MKRAFIVVCAAVVMFLMVGYAQSHEVNTGWLPWTQPDGTSFIGRAWGNEFAMSWETPDGYRFERDVRTGWCCYAELDEEGEPRPGRWKVGIDSPEVHGISKGLEQTPARKAAIEEEMRRMGFLSPKGRRSGKMALGSLHLPGPRLVRCTCS